LPGMLIAQIGARFGLTELGHEHQPDLDFHHAP